MFLSHLRLFLSPGFMIGTCMKWACLRRLCMCPQSTPLLATRNQRGDFSFINSNCLQVWSFLCEVHTLKLSEQSTGCESKASLGAQSGLLWRWQRVLFTLPIILVIFFLIVIVRIVHQSHQTALKTIYLSVSPSLVSFGKAFNIQTTPPSCSPTVPHNSICLIS